MSDDIENVAENDLLLELREVGLDGLTQVVQKVIDLYVENHDVDYVLAQNQMLIALSTVTGELLACIPDEDDLRDFVEQKVHNHITDSRKDNEEERLTAEEDPHGLSRMTPQGNC